MYFPYIRGRQYELIALRELAEKKLLNEQIVPIIEPVKLSSPLRLTLMMLIKAKQPFAIIVNPSVGNFPFEYAKAKSDDPNKIVFNEILRNPLVTPAVIFNKSAILHLQSLNHIGRTQDEILVVFLDQGDLDLYKKTFNKVPPRFVLIPNSPTLKSQTKVNRVLFQDHFNKQQRNADYAHNEDEFFSDDYLVYKDEDFVGFSDFSTIGAQYDDNGFAPKAVAIHIVYFKENTLRIVHFVSSSNADTKDPERKFYEATQSLSTWYHDNPNIVPMTYGLSCFLQYYINQGYPGLGTVKKLSIMHHIELMSKYFENLPKV